jgi:hypothetical protein
MLLCVEDKKVLRKKHYEVTRGDSLYLPRLLQDVCRMSIVLRLGLPNGRLKPRAHIRGKKYRF